MKKKKAKKKPLAKGKATSSPLTKAQVKGFEETDKASKNLKVAICLFLMVATFCTYSQIQDHEFIDFDTDFILTQNLNVQAGLTIESFKWAFTTSHPPYWHPITWLSHMLDYQLYGLHPKGHKLTNLFLHISSALILFIVLLRMTGTLWQSGFVATMFALHPLNVESVVWIAERKNVLSTFFWLMTMWTYFHYAEKPTFKRYGLVFLFFTLGMMSKPMLVTLPFALLLLDYWPLRRLKLGQERDSNEILEKTTTKRSEIFRLVLEKVPLFLLTVGLSIVTVYYQNIAGALKSLDLFPLQARLTNAIVSYLEYLGKMIWPSGLAVFYPHPESSLATWKWGLCFLVLITITTISIRFIKKAPYFIVGWFWYLGTLIPVIGVVQVGAQSMADRYTYIPLIGIFIIVAWGVPELISKWRYKEKVLSISVGIIIIILLITTWGQVSHWKNSITIFKHAFRVANEKPYNTYLINYYLGNAFWDKGKTGQAISQFKMAIKRKPEFAVAHNNLGIVLDAEGKNEEAISHYKMAIKFNPDDFWAHNKLGHALVQKGEMKEAVYHYRETVRLRPDLDAAHDNLEFALLRLRKLE